MLTGPSITILDELWEVGWRAAAASQQLYGEVWDGELDALNLAIVDNL
jgi:hypothetical protein